MPVPVAATAPELESSMLARAARILYAFNTATPEMTMTDVVRRTGLPRSSVHRILDQLVQLRALERSGARYRLGLGLIELGALAAHQNRLRAVALPYLHALHAATGALVHLAILDGHEIVYLEKVGGRPGGPIPSRLGGRQPAYCTAAGKAILAFADEAELAEVLAAGLPPRTPYTITKPQLLRQELAHVRERGIAFDREENYRGIFCLGAPLRDVTGRPIAAISLSGPPNRMNQGALAPALLSSARQVWRALFTPGRRSAGAGTQPRQQPATEPAPAPQWHRGALDEMANWSRLADWM